MARSGNLRVPRQAFKPVDRGIQRSIREQFVNLREAGQVLLVDRVLFVVMVLGIIQTSRPKITLVAYLIATVGVFLERKNVFRLLQQSVPLVLLLLLAASSMVWSIARDETLTHVAGLFGTCAIGFFGVCRLGLRGFIDTFAIALGIAALLSGFLAVFVPGIGIQDDGVTRGLFSYKTQLGLGMVVSMLTIACAIPGSKGRLRNVLIAGFLVSLAMLSRANSATGIISTISLGIALPLLIWSRSKQTIKPALFGILALFAVMLFAQSDFGEQAFALLGRDSTLTGRTGIWEGAVTAIGDKPALGFGYGAFWSLEGPWQQYIDGLWEPGAAHNGYLETMLNFGLIGEGLLVIFIAVGLWRTATSFWRGNDIVSAWPLCIMLNAVLTNYAEATFLYDRIDWLAIMAAFLFATADPLRKERVEQSTLLDRRTSHIG